MVSLKTQISNQILKIHGFSQNFSQISHEKNFSHVRRSLPQLVNHKFSVALDDIILFSISLPPVLGCGHRLLVIIVVYSLILNIFLCFSIVLYMRLKE